MEPLAGVLGCPGPEAFCVHSPLWLGDLLPGELPTFAPCLEQMGHPLTPILSTFAFPQGITGEDSSGGIQSLLSLSLALTWAAGYQVGWK